MCTYSTVKEEGKGAKCGRRREERRRRRRGNFSTPIFLPLLGQGKKKSRKWVLWKRKEDDGQLCFSFSGSEKSFSLPPVLFARSRKREKVKVMLILFIKHLTVITPLSFSSPLALCALSFPRKTISGPSPPLRPTHLGPGRGCRKKEGILKNRKGRGRGRENRRRKETRK